MSTLIDKDYETRELLCETRKNEARDKYRLAEFYLATGIAGYLVLVWIAVEVLSR